MIKKILDSNLFWLLILVSAFTLFYWYNSNKTKKFEDRILKNAALTIGVIDEVGFRAKQGDNVAFHFEINGKLHYDQQNYSDLGALTQKILNKSFPVIYDSTDVTYNELLITPEDFEAYKMPYPDSLKWVLKYRK